MTLRCTAPSPLPCRHPPDYWIGVEGVAYLSCAVHRTVATRSGAWVETDWTAPPDGPAPRFSGRPRSAEPVPEEPPPLPKRPIGRPKGERPAVSLTVRPAPAPRTWPNQITHVEVDDLTPPGMCRNGWCPGRKGGGHREAHSVGLCKSCRVAAGRLGCLATVALAPPPPRAGVRVEVDPAIPAHLCRNRHCLGNGTRKAHSRGLCDTCALAAKRAGVYEAVALPMLRGGRPGALRPCMVCEEETTSEFALCKRHSARARYYHGRSLVGLDADTLLELASRGDP